MPARALESFDHDFLSAPLSSDFAELRRFGAAVANQFKSKRDATGLTLASLIRNREEAATLHLHQTARKDADFHGPIHNSPSWIKFTLISVSFVRKGFE